MSWLALWAFEEHWVLFALLLGRFLILSSIAFLGPNWSDMVWIGKEYNRRKLGWAAQRVVISGTTSSWQLVTRAVPKGPVLVPLPINVFVSDLDNRTECALCKFTEDTRSGRSDQSSKLPIKCWTESDPEEAQWDVIQNTHQNFTLIGNMLLECAFCFSFNRLCTYFVLNIPPEYTSPETVPTAVHKSRYIHLQY